jgi:hypothetical protein
MVEIIEPAKQNKFIKLRNEENKMEAMWKITARRRRREW